MNYSIINSYGLQSPKVDREKRLITGFAVACKGPAAGHGEHLDDTSLDQIVQLGNAANTSTGTIRARMDHPSDEGTIENPLAKILGKPVNFRRDGDVVRADLQLLSAGAAPLADRLLSLAEEAPDLLGASMVFDYADGKAHMKAVQKKQNPPVRIRQIFAIDFVDLPATNPQGLFSAGSNKEKSMPATGPLKAYVRNGGLFCNVGGDEYAIEMPDEAKKLDAGDGDGEEGAKKGKQSAKSVDANAHAAAIETAKQEAIKEEREYAKAFNTAIATAGISGKAAEEFTTTFYGRRLEDVKFLASAAIGSRAKPVGEGSGDSSKTDAEKQAEADKKFEAECAARFAAKTESGEARYALLGVKNSDPTSDEYKAGLRRFVNIERQWVKDNPARS